MYGSAVTTAAIAGAHETPYARHPPDGTDTTGILAAAVAGALADAGIDHGAVDGLGVASFSLVPDHAIDLAWRLGLRVRWLMDDANGGASAVNMLQHAVRAIEAGDAETIVLCAGDHLDRAAFRRLVEEYNRATAEHLTPLGYAGPNALFAMLTQRWLAARGLDRAALGAIPVAQRAWASGNPGAVYRDPLTLEDYLASPFVAEPLTRYDCVPVVTGADAIVVTASPRRRPAARAGARDRRAAQPRPPAGRRLRRGLHRRRVPAVAARRRASRGRRGRVPLRRLPGHGRRAGRGARHRPRRRRRPVAAGRRARGALAAEHLGRAALGRPGRRRGRDARHGRGGPPAPRRRDGPPGAMPPWRWSRATGWSSMRHGACHNAAVLERVG